MSTDTNEGLESPDRQTEPTENYSTCLDRGRAVATDGGLVADDVIGACDICEENQGVTSEDVVNDETGEMTTAWLCSECLDRLERYNRGDDAAFEDVVTDGGQEMTEWECGNCGDSFETPAEPELPCLQCGVDDWREVDAE